MTRTRLASLLALGLVLGLGGPRPADARLFFIAGDPALQGGVVLPLDASIGLTPGIQQLSQSQPIGGGASVELRFATSHPSGMYANVFLGRTAFVSFFPDGVQIDFTPPVGAVGVDKLVAECGAMATFEGSAATEQHVSPGGAPLFIGAADIGAISRVTLNGTCFAAAWGSLHFAPDGTIPPTDEADLSLVKEGLPAAASQEDGRVVWQLEMSNAGPDPSREARSIDFLPYGTNLVAADPLAVLLPGTQIAQQGVGALAPGDDFPLTLETDIPPFHPGPGSLTSFRCESVMMNVALATARSIDPDPSENLAVASVRFDKESRSGMPEICDNGVDDDCNGRSDCSEFGCRSHPHCRPPVVDYGPSQPWDCFQEECLFPEDIPPPPEECTVQDIHGRARSMPEFCCGPDAPRDPFGNLAQRCQPGDPNFKVADPPVNAQGFGYTEAGLLHRYAITYENVGGVDALDVRVIDVLDEDLDDATLVVANGGAYDPQTRAIVWSDPTLPPQEPRTVEFQVAVRDDAPPFTRVRNIAHVLFPEAAVPLNATNLVEHVVLDPALVTADPGVIGCTETAPGSGEWTAHLFLRGNAFAWNPTAEIVDPPASVQVVEGQIAFGSSGDPVDDFRSAPPHNTTPGLDTVRFTTETPGDPCRALTWRIRWEDVPGGDILEERVQVDPDADADAVADAADNCPQDYNPGQQDADADGAGDACDNPEPPPAIADLAARAKRGKVDLVWTPPANAVRYDVHRGEVAAGGAAAPLPLLAAGHVSEYGVYADFTASDGITWAYEVVWFDAAGNASPPSNRVRVTPGPRAATPPPACGEVALAPLLLAGLASRMRAARRRFRRRPAGT